MRILLTDIITLLVENSYMRDNIQGAVQETKGNEVKYKVEDEV